MRITITKFPQKEHVAIARNDGTTDQFAIPRKGPVPHDAFHFFIEARLGMVDGFWGNIARGEHPDAIQERAKMGGHASAMRAGKPSADLITLLQAERLVECFEAESWAQCADDDALLAMARVAWEASFVPELDITREDLRGIRAAIAGFAAEWDALPDGQSVILDWDDRLS